MTRLSSRDQASFKLVITAYNYALSNEQILVLIAKPLHHVPKLSLKIPPAPAVPGLPLLQPIKLQVNLQFG
jgi:hypothetical protein